MSKRYPNAASPIPDDYVEMMRHYIPKMPMAAIRDAWKNNATPLEVMRHFERIEGKEST